MLKPCEQAPATSDYHQPTERMVAEVLQVVREQRDRIERLEVAVANLARQLENQSNDGR